MPLHHGSHLESVTIVSFCLISPFLSSALFSPCSVWESKEPYSCWNERFYRPDVIPDIRSAVSQSAAVSGDKLTEQTYTTYTLF